MTEEYVRKGYRPAEYTTFEKGEQLLAMARRDKNIAATLKGGTSKEKKEIFLQAGLSESEVEEVLITLERAFDIELGGRTKQDDRDYW